ncbi:sensor histidine kinase [Streptomyces sp. NPDC098789]|uniref:sensor histidine kinase n=1 Tax=Streptomyces sp. NPDC098789 TaxID=3366098 RepID=UPI003819947F
MPTHVYRLAQRKLRALGRCETPLSPRQRLFQDAVLAVLVGAASCLALATVHGTGLFLGYGSSVACALVAAGSLMWRRTRPELCVAVALATTLASDEGTALIAAVYATAVYGRRRPGAVVGAAVLGYVCTRPLIGDFVDDPRWQVYVAVVNFVVPAMLGCLVRRQRELRERLRERLSSAESAIDSAARFAILEKRTQLAFEIHDTVGHHATYLVMRAGAAQRRKGLTPEVAAEFGAIQDGAITVMQELRGVINVLREPDDPDEPLRGHLSCNEFLEGLTRNMRAIGMDASHAVEGRPRDLGQRCESLLYRVSREALTNAAKYAPGAPVRVRLVYGPGTVSLQVVNGRTCEHPGPGAGYGSAGLGLRGLTDALVAVGGCFDAGPVAGGGYRVQAVVPLPAGPDRVAMPAPRGPTEQTEQIQHSEHSENEGRAL